MPPPPRFILIGGGARSGKSAFALMAAQQLGARRVFLATGEGLDDEMRDRIARHQQERAGRFVTVEEPLAVPEALEATREADVVLVDCLTLWLSNMLVRNDPVERVRQRVDELYGVIRRRRFHVVLVTNEVGMGLVPDTALGRSFRDVVGQAHQRLAAGADRIYAAMMGQMLRLHPGPVQLCRDFDAF